MKDPLLTAAARRHVTRLLQAVAPHADRLDRRFRLELRRRGWNLMQVRAFLEVTPAAAARLASRSLFREQVEYNGRRLAKLDVPPGEVHATLQAFDTLLDDVLPKQFGPAREQLYLATILSLHHSFYAVRDAEAQAFFEIYRAEAEAQDLDDLLRRFVATLTRTFRASTGRLLLLERAPAGKLARPLYIERGQARESLIADPEMRAQCASYWSFPMAKAVLQFGFAGPYPWLPREAVLLQAVAERCQEAIEKAQMKAEIRRLEAAARSAEEEERRRLGRELHDEAGQSLLALRLRLELLEREADERLRPRLAEARGIAEHTVEELRRIVAALSPALLERLGLEAALRHLSAGFRKIHAAVIGITISTGMPELTMPIQEVIYRVAQESLQNIAKHSEATRVNLLLQSTDRWIRLSISDNGAGFQEQAALSKPMSFGLAGMRERASLLQGRLAIRSAPGKGVTVLLELPHRSLR